MCWGQCTLHHSFCSYVPLAPVVVVVVVVCETWRGPVPRLCWMSLRTARRAGAYNGFLSAEALYQFLQAIVWQRVDLMIVAAGHGMIVHQRIDDRLFAGLHHPCEKRIH